MNANDDAAAQAKHLRQARKAEQKRLRKLERELHRKDKALAETAALLTLSKRGNGSSSATTVLIGPPQIGVVDINTCASGPTSHLGWATTPVCNFLR